MPTEREQIRKLYNEGGEPITTFVSADMAAKHPGIDEFFEVRGQEDFEEEKPEKKLLDQDVRQTSFYTTALSGEEQGGFYEKVRNELETYGNSTTVSRLKDTLSSEQNTTRKKIIEDLLLDETISQEEKFALVQGYLETKSQDVDLQQSYIEALATEDNASSAEEAEQQDIVVDNLDKYVKVQKEKQKLMNAAMARNDASTGSALADFLGLLVPYTEGIDVRQIAEGGGYNTSIIDNILIGSTKKRVHDALMRLPPEQQLAQAELLTRAVEEHSGTLDRNGMAVFYHLQDMVGEGIPDWQVWVDNAVGILDALGLAAGVARWVPVARAGKAAVKAVKAIGKGSKAAQPLNELELTINLNPSSGSELAAAAVNDKTGKLAEAMGTTKGDIVVDYSLPKPEGSDITGAPDSIVRHMEEIDVIGDRVLRDSEQSNPLAYTELERKASRLEVWKSLRSVVGLKQHLNKSNYVYKNDGSFRISSVYGKDDVSGFLNKDEAVEQANRTFGEGEYELLSKDFETGEIHPAKEGETRGDFYVKYNYQDRYNPTAVAALGIDGMPAVPTFGRAAKYMASPATRFQEIVRAPGLQGVDVAAGYEKDIIHGITSVLAKLGRKSQGRVFDVVERGAKEQKNYSYQDLKYSFDLSDKEAKAYLSFRKAQDVLWSATNRDEYRNLRREGYKSIYGADVDQKLFAKELTEEAALRNLSEPSFQYYDLGKGIAVRPTSDELLDLYKGGGQVVELRGGLYSRHNRYNYAIVRPEEGVSLGALTRSPVNYIEGYYQRFYEDPYFVVKEYANGRVDGKRAGTSEVVANVASIHEAKELAKRAATRTEEEGVTYNIRRGREYAKRERDFESLRSSGLLSTRRRGEHLQGYEELAKTTDQLRSYEKTARAVSNKLGVGEAIEVAERRFAKDFPDFLDSGKLPASVKAIKEQGVLDSGRTGAAIQRFEYIQTLKNFPGKFDDAYRNFIFNMSEVFDSNALAKGITKELLERDNPLQFSRNVAFTLFLSLSPARQILVQSGQVAQFSFMDPLYLASGKMVRDNAALGVILALNKGKASDATWDKWGKALGYKKGEFKATADGLANSGLLAAINLNELLHANAATMHNSMIRRPVDLAKRWGFEAGEQVLLANSYMFAKHRWQKANPGKKWDDPGNIEKIAFDARELSYSMTRPGKFGYQGHPDSLLSDFAAVITQFTSVPHKALEQMTTGKTLTRREKLQLIAGNIIMFGGSSFPIINYVLDKYKSEIDKEVELTDDEWLGLKGGMMDYSLNKGIRKITEDDTTLLFSENFAPAGGGMLPFALLSQEFWDDSLAETIQKIPAGSAYSKIYKALRQASLVVTAPEANWGSKEFKESVFNMASGMSNYYKYRTMMETGKAISSTGQETVDVTEAEAWARPFGIGTQAESDYYRTLKNIRKVEQDIRDDADKFYDDYKAIMRRTEGDVSQRDLLLGNHRNFWHIYKDKEERDVALDQLRKRSMQDLSSGEESLTYLIGKQMGLGGDFLEEAYNETVNNKALSTEKREALLNLYQSLKENE